MFGAQGTGGILSPNTSHKGDNMKTATKLTFDEWFDQFEPLTNPFDEADGTLLETFGRELEYVLTTLKDTPLHVWTYIDGSDGTYIVEGYLVTNRIGYYITKKPAEPQVEYDVLVDLYGEQL